MQLKQCVFLVLLVAFSCKQDKVIPFKDTHGFAFTKIPKSHSNIDFKNTVKEDLYFNFLNYSYIYNGGGVAVGDINNDGLEDIYFTSNQQSNKLYLNKGNFQFEDVTAKANVKDDSGWSTGVCMIDINNDGWLDIYVCKSGELKNPALRQNKLYVNQKNGTFKEVASKYGLNHSGFSTQSYFFDYDNDDDLDMYLVNHRVDFNNNTVINPALQRQLTQEDSDHLFRNDNGRFTNVTQQAKIANKAWGLSASIGDFNQDGWPDIYVANDFLEPDMLYINKKDGTFENKILDYFGHISTNSMGSDFADVNNDLLPDLIVLDMMAQDRIRGKENMATMSTENFNLMVNSGYHHQYMSNMLQLNNGNNSFSEIGQLSNISRTDWSWAPLIADFNNDGFNDVFITNGIEHDLSNQDFRNQMKQKIINRKKVSLEDAINMMPSSKLNNYLLLNNQDLTFKDVSKAFGFNDKINSNGAAYADLDNDGDLDLVVNNQSQTASIYRNNCQENYIRLSLKGSSKNINGIGAKLEIYTNSTKQTKEIYPSRGYQSSMGYGVNFGLGQATIVDSLRITWRDKRTQLLTNLSVNSDVKLNQADAKISQQKRKMHPERLTSVSAENFGIDYKHEAVNFNDYDNQLLLPQKQSTLGQALVVGDINNDGLEDIFIGNTIENASKLYVQEASGRFKKTNENLFEGAKQFNDNNALFFDVDNDNDLDIYIASGNYSQLENSNLLQDRLYINDGNGNFSKGSLPKMHTVTKALTVHDFDSDGDLDLFVGGRVVPGKYPQAPKSYLLENRGGRLVNSTLRLAPELQNVGLVNDAVFSDYDKDGDKDLIIAGEWMPITIFNYDNGKFNKIQNATDSIKGWFQTIKAIDLDNDGDDDYLVGNYGENNKFHPTIDNPLHIYANYFDDNLSYDLVLSKASQGALFPIRGKECSSQQTPFLNEKITSFKAFANATITDIYGETNIKNALHLKATSFSSYYIKNNSGTFEFIPLPTNAQLGPTLDFEFFKGNNKGIEVVGIGSIYDAEVETIRYDALKGYAIHLEDDSIEVNKSVKAFTRKEAKAIEKIRINGQEYMVILNANAPISIFKVHFKE